MTGPVPRDAALEVTGTTVTRDATLPTVDAFAVTVATGATGVDRDADVRGVLWLVQLL